MSSWLGFRNVSGTSTLTFAVNTHSASTGAATDATGNPTYRVYEDETGTPILTGSMAKLDDSNTTGFYTEELTISSGNGFEAGKTYTIYIEATVGSVTGTTERHFACWPATINSQIDSNIVQISGDATAADNLEAAADGTGYNLGGGSIVAASVSGAVNSVTTGVTVATNNDKTGYSLATAPPTAGDIADAVWDEATSGHTTAGTYGGRVVRATNSNVEVQVTGSNHIAADVHAFQADVIDAAAIAANAIDASALATDAVTEIAQGVLSEATNTATYAAGDVGNVLGRLHNMIEADGADFRYTTNALEQAPGGGGGGSTTVRMGPFEVRAEGQASDLPLDINKTATHGIDCILVDAQGTGVDLTGATLSTKVYNTSGTLVATISGTATYAAGGAMTWTIPTSVTNTAGTYTATITRTTGASDTEVFGPLRIYVRDI